MIGFGVVDDVDDMILFAVVVVIVGDFLAVDEDIEIAFLMKSFDRCIALLCILDTVTDAMGRCKY